MTYAGATDGFLPGWTVLSPPQRRVAGSFPRGGARGVFQVQQTDLGGLL